MARQKRNPAKKSANRTPPKAGARPVGLRVVGGSFRGRKLLYSGDPRVRPMKDRVREAVFNLVGPSVKDKHAVDLFAGTGALGLEALSRGAQRATLIEQHLPTVAVIRQNVATLGVESIAEIINGDVFIWLKQCPDLGTVPWIVFSSPPYDYYVQRRDDMLELLGSLIELAPAESIFVVETDDRFQFDLLPDLDQWRLRCYPPAVVGVYEKPNGE